MNILIVEDMASSTFGGAERSMHRFAEMLANEEHRIHYVYDRPGDYSLSLGKPYASITNVSTLPLRAQPMGQWIASVGKLVRLCRENRIDLIVTHVVHSLGMLRLVKIITGTKVTAYFKWVCGTARVGRQASWGLAGFDHAAAVSQFVADYWVRNGCPEALMTVVPEGVEVSPRSGFHAQQPLANGSSFRVAFAGRLVPEKGLHVLLEALARLTRAGMKVTCTVAGLFPPAPNPSASYQKTIESLIEQHRMSESVSFAGYVDPLLPLLERHDAVVVPSLCQDAQPLVMMQAMSAGVPVVASRVGGIPEVLCDGLSRWLFEPGDVGGLSALIGQLESMGRDPRENLGRVLRETIERRYTLDAHYLRLKAALAIA